MTKIKVFNNKGNTIGYTIEGHTGYDVAGSDILCSAISILGQTALIALDEVCDIDEEDIDYTIRDEEGYLSVTIPGDLSSEKQHCADIVLQTMIVGIKGLIENYPDYITLEYGEV